ncbi:MAG: hypothetical protein Tsb0014_24530 [Pleurocapsa sp.]
MNIFKNSQLLAKSGIASVTAIVLFSGVDAAQALEFVSNFSEASGNDGVLLGSTFWEGSSFTTDSDSYTLNAATLSLEEIIEGDLFIRLYDDNGGQPGSILSELTTSADIDGSPYDLYEFVPTFSVGLDPNTTYWLIGGTTDSSFYRWESATSGNETSSGSWTIDSQASSSNQGFAWSMNERNPNIFSIDATVVSAAVPFEFSPTLGLLLMGGVFGGSRAYRRYCAAKLDNLL